jgi:3-mercaptopyruvate sulfurtransferase SseA
MGGIIGALVVGLVLVVFLLVNNQGQAPTAGTNANNQNQNAPNAQPTADLTQPEVANPNPEPTVEPARRMELADFKALYDDPANRPMIVDVRAEEAFRQGHIQGAVNIPEADLDTRVAEFPRDKLIVAYCQ